MNMHMVRWSCLNKGISGMNKKILLAAGLIALMAFTAVITFKSLDGLDQLDLSDQFEDELSNDTR